MPKRSDGSSFLALAVLVATVAIVAFARAEVGQSSLPSSRAATGAAQGSVVEPYEQEMKRGVSARDAARHSNQLSDWGVALFHFQQALNVRLTWQAHFELAWAAESMGLPAEALGQYSAALAASELPARGRMQAEAFIEAHRRQMAFVHLSDAREAIVYVDRQLRARLPKGLALPVLAGSTALLLQGPGLPDWRKTLVLQAGETVALVAFAPQNADYPTRSTVAGETVLKSVLAAGGAPTLSAKETVGHDVPAPWSSLQPELLWGGLSLALVGGVTAGVTTMLLTGARSDLSAACTVQGVSPCPRAKLGQQSNAQGAANQILTLQNLRWAGAGSAAVGVLAGAIGLLLPSPPGSLADTQAQVHLSPHETHFQLIGNF